MLYFFYGADSFRIKQKANSIIEAYKAKHKSGLNFCRFDFAEEGTFDKFRNFINSSSMFAEKKLAIIENLLVAEKNEQNKFLKYLAEGDILKNADKFAVVAQELERNTEKKAKEKYVLKNSKELFRKLTAKGVNFEEFDFLSGVKLENWIKKEAERNGGQIDSSAVRKLAVLVGSDLWRLKNEIDKLKSFKSGGIISEKDISLLVKGKIENDIFKTVDALALKQKEAAFALMHRHLAEGESEIYLLGMLAYQFRNLLLVKSLVEQGIPFYSLGQKIKLHPFVLRKSFEQSQNFSLSALKNIYEKLSEADIGIKTGLLEPRVALDLLVKEIVG